MPTSQRRAVIYARYSTDLQNPTSTADQIAKCRRFAKAEGWRIVAEYGDHAMSGASSARPDFRRLLSDLASGTFDTVLTERLDRISRDTEDTAHFYKRTRHHDIEIHTLHQGKVDILQIGFSGLMGSIFLKELAEKTHRGVEAAVVKGQSGGGRSYGYRVSRNAAGDRITGSLEIDPGEGAIVRRIFEDYARGISPLDIATTLNAEGVPAPRSGRGKDTHWKQNTINGNRERGTGILNNQLYVGQRVWNRHEYRKHPDTGKRISRPRPRDEWQTVDVPDLRLIDDDLWTRVKTRQDSLRKVHCRETARTANGIDAAHGTRRRRYLLSGLLECGQCGGKLIVGGQGHGRRYYCANNKQKGASVCSGMPGVRQADVEHLVLDAFKRDLMTDAAYDKFRRDFAAHLERNQDDNREAVRALDTRLAEARRRREGLMVNIESGRVPESVITRLDETEAEIGRLEEERADAEPKPIALPENLPDLYRAYVADLATTLGAESVVGRASDELRGLIERLVIPHDVDAERHRVAVYGDLARILGAADSKNAASYEDAARSLELVAGSGFEPLTFRL